MKAWLPVEPLARVRSKGLGGNPHLGVNPPGDIFKHGVERASIRMRGYGCLGIALQHVIAPATAADQLPQVDLSAGGGYHCDDAINRHRPWQPAGGVSHRRGRL
jgi:hypothetical protein